MTNVLPKIVKINEIFVPVYCMDSTGRSAWVLAFINPDKTIAPYHFTSIWEAEIKVIELEMNGVKAKKRMPVFGLSAITIEIEIPKEK